MAKNQQFPSSAETMDIHRCARSSSGSIGSSTLEKLLEGGHMEVRELPEELLHWLVGLRLLERVPFHYIVPDARLLPAESVRFFHVDRTWTDRLVDGAMSAGAVGNGELELARDVAAAARGALDEASGSFGELVSGFLLRSTLVRRWPRMEVRAYKLPNNVNTKGTNRGVLDSDQYRLRNLRISRLSEGILLVMWHGVPNYVEIEEPKHGVQFGVNQDATGSERNVEHNKVEFAVTNRPGALSNVLNIRALSDAGIGGTESMALALQQMPFIQPFRAHSVIGEEHYPEQPPAQDSQMLFQLAKTVPIWAKYAAAVAAQDPTATKPQTVGPINVVQAVHTAIQTGVAFLNEGKTPGGNS